MPIAFKLGAIGHPCCPCGTTCAPTTICVFGCNATPIENAAVAIPSLGLSCTTDATGCCTMAIPSAGTRTVTVTPPSALPEVLSSRYNNASVSRSLLCGGTNNITLTAKTGYCCTTCFEHPIPTTLSYNFDGVTGTFSPCSGNVTLCLNKAATGITYPFNQCLTALSSDPCTIGSVTSGAKLHIFIAGGGADCTIIQETDCGTDCTSLDGTCTNLDAPYFTAHCSGSTYVPGNFVSVCGCIWLELPGSTPHYGQNGTCSQNLSLGTGNSVPVNISANFSNPGGNNCECFPLFNNVMITE